MNIPDLYIHDDYISFIHSVVKANREQRGFQSQLCQRLNCQPAKFSRALNGSMELTRDQVANLCHVLKLNDLETEYLLSIYDFKLSSSHFLRERAQAKIKKIKSEVSRISAQLKDVSEALDRQIAFEYYSSWVYSAVNILLTIPEYQSFEKIKNRIKIEDDDLQRVLAKLVEWGMVKKVKAGYESLEKSLHLDKSHPVSGQDHINWRLKAIEDIQKKKEASLHYSAIFSMSKNDVERFKKYLVENIKNHRELISKSKSEEMFVCNMDFFQF